MYAYRQEGCIESIAPAHPTYPRHHLNSHHVNHTHPSIRPTKVLNACGCHREVTVRRRLTAPRLAPRSSVPAMGEEGGRGDGGEGSLTLLRTDYNSLKRTLLGPRNGGLASRSRASPGQPFDLLRCVPYQRHSGSLP